MKVPVLNIKGKTTGREVELSKKVFESFDDAFISFTKACNEYVSTKIWAFAS